MENPQIPGADMSNAKDQKEAIRPWFKKKRFLLPIALVVLIGWSSSMNAGGTSSNLPTPDSEGQVTAQPSEETAPAFPDETVSQKNAREKADSYLSNMAFSKKGLEEQLAFEGFSAEDAAYGVGAVTVDWNEQAALKAKSYLDTMSFSHSSLVDQLVFEGFTAEQAEYGVSTTGL